MYYVVYTETHTEGTIERWYWGAWKDRTKANEAALELGNDPGRGVWHCVCREDEAESLGILNMWG